MNRRFLTTATVALALVWASSASATQSRIRSMGGGIKQLTVLDDTNIFFLPAELVKYGTWAAIEIGAADVTSFRGTPGTSFQIHYNFNPTMVLGVYGSNQSVNAIRLGASNRFPDLNGPDLANAAGIPGFSNTGDAGATHKGTILFGLDLGASRIGFLLSAWADAARQFDPQGNIVTNQGPLYIDFGFGAGFAVGPGDIDLGLKVGFGTPTDEDGQGALHEGKQIDLGVIFRGTFPFSGPHEIVPFATLDLGFGDARPTADNSPSFSGLLFNFLAGVDVRLNLGDGIVVQPGIGLEGGTYRLETTAPNGDISTQSQHLFVFPFYNLAVDVKVTEWFDIRFGGAQRVFWTWNGGTDADGNDIAHSSAAQVQHRLATGVGFNLPAGVSLDIEVSTGWWQQGPYLVTGDGTPGGFGMNAAISKDW